MFLQAQQIFFINIWFYTIYLHYVTTLLKLIIMLTSNRI